MPPVMLPVCETFSSIQGEVQGIGEHCFFLRTFGCNLGSRCPVPCDTTYSWDVAGGATPARHVDIETMAREIDLSGAWNVVVTGGEPLLHQGTIVALIDATEIACKHPIRWYIETNGTIVPAPSLVENTAVHFNVSPKIEPFSHETFPLDRSVFKHVAGLDDLERVTAAISALSPATRRRSFIMPRSTTRAEYVALAPRVATWCAARGVNLGPRLHLLAWDGSRGT